jgi:uncharacterized protein YndB with AHSA1/START domain
MGQQRHELGRIVRTGDDAIVQLERDFAATPDEVWQMLTEPDRLANWLQASVDLEPYAGGAITLRFANTGTTIRGQIVHFDAPKVLEYTWSLADEPASVVRFELRPAATSPGTHLCLTHARCGDNPPKLFAAGWHHHLELLAAQLAGQPVAWDWERYKEVFAQYGASAA